MTSSRILGLIPARGGSKGIPDKNIARVGGQPLITHTIAAALAAAGLARVLVSTDDARIAAISRACGAEVPFLRSAATSGDTARTIDAVLEVLDRLEGDGEWFDAVCLLQPTTPLRAPGDIEAAIRLWDGQRAAAVVSVSRLDEPHPAKLQVIREGRLQPFLPGADASVPRQSLEPVYQLNGAVYLTPVSVLRRARSFFATTTLPLEMPPERSVNINGWLDLKLADLLLQERGR